MPTFNRARALLLACAIALSPLSARAEGIENPGLSAGSAANITVGTSTISGGANTRVLYDNAGFVGEYTAAQVTALINTATTSLSGALPAWPGNTTTFFRGDGSYATLNCAALTNSTATCTTSIGTSGATIPLLSTANTWALAQTFTTAPVFTDASGSRTALGLGSIATVTPGTGVNTALAINVGSAGALVTNGGALGTPSSGTLTNATGLPIGGITGLGSNQSTFLAANLTVNGALKLNGSGTPSQAACADLSNATGACSATYTVPTTWTPADGSGASLTFTSVSANYTRIGNMVFAYASLTYPSTASGSNAIINGLPISTPSAGYGQQCHISYSNSSTVLRMAPATSAASISLYTAAGGAVTNAQMTGAILNFICIYPAT